MVYCSMVPGNLPSQLEILSTGQTYYEPFSAQPGIVRGFRLGKSQATEASLRFCPQAKLTTELSLPETMMPVHAVIAAARSYMHGE